MPLKLNKTRFSRPRAREKDLGDIFNKTSSSITNLMPFIIPLFFAPALITTSLFSKEIILMLANISLGLGYISNFAYRVYRNEVSKSELFISAIILSHLLLLTYVFYPAIVAVSFLNVLGFINQMAAAVNLFFLVKHNVVPPFMRIIESVAQFVGLDVTSRYYSKPPLTLEEDRYVLDKLMVQTYGYDTFDPRFEEKKIGRFNKMLNKLSAYINKYDQSLFGYLQNKDNIADLESQINLLTVQGNPDSSYSFMRKKIGFKTTKIKLLETAQKAVETAIQTETYDRAALKFFTNVNEDQLKTNPKSLFLEGSKCLEIEIQRQKEKIESLEACLPATASAPVTPTMASL